MNLAQRITVGVALLLMGLFTFDFIYEVLFYTDEIYLKDHYIHYLLLIGFVGGGLFVLFGIKRKKKNKE